MTSKIKTYRMLHSLILLAIALVLSQVMSARADINPEKTESTTDSFAECAKDEGAISKDSPTKCVSKDGRVFIDESKQAKTNCKDLCGDGTCQEIVCMAIGCPCPESPKSCPADCGGN